MTTLEVALRSQIAATGVEIDRACLKAELAAHLARMGRYDSAQSIVAEIRATPHWGSAKLTSLVLFAEAMIRLEDEFDLRALDRLARAFAISNAANLHHVATGIASWIAHYNFNRSQFVETRKWLMFCSDHRKQLSTSTLARLCLTIADASRFSGDFDASDRWYSRSRQMAVRTGDEVFLAANMYNRAAYGIARLRLDWARDDMDATVLDRSRLEIESAANYSIATKNTAAQSLQRLWLGRLLQLKLQHSDAVPIFETALSDLPEAKHARLRGGILADLAFSKLELGDSLPATELLSRIDGEIEAALETDDRVVYLAQLVRFADVLSTASSTSLRARLQLAITAHSAVTVELSTQIKDLDFFASDQPQIDGAVR